MDTYLCPSYRPEPGARILAVETEAGVLAYLDEAVELDEEAARRLNEAEEARKHLRLVGPCLESKCGQWAQDRCGVVGKVQDQLVAASRLTRLPPCKIRSSCRWFSQSGRTACEVCAEVRTEIAG